jgi:hypothetical protein
MTTPHKCPVCNGKGELGRKKARSNATVLRTETNKNGKPRQVFQCHACIGTGVLWDFNTFTTSPLQFPFIPYCDDKTFTVQSVQDGVVRCEDCGEPMHVPPGAKCNNLSWHWGV